MERKSEGGEAKKQGKETYGEGSSKGERTAKENGTENLTRQLKRKHKGKKSSTDKRAAKKNGQHRRMDQQTRKSLRMIDDNTGSERMERRRMQRLSITRNFFEATEEEIESKYLV
jgi:hypothetical protein